MSYICDELTLLLSRQLKKLYDMTPMDKNAVADEVSVCDELYVARRKLANNPPVRQVTQRAFDATN